MPEQFPVIKHRYQKDPKYQALAEKVLRCSPEESKLCWLACTDMAISPVLATEPDRLNFIREFLEKLKTPSTNGLINEHGALIESGWGEAISKLKLLRDQWGLPLGVVNIFNLKPDGDIIDRLRDKQVIIFTTNNGLGVGNGNKVGHARVIDRLFWNPQFKAVVGYLDPATPDPVEARRYFDFNQRAERELKGVRWGQYIQAFYYPASFRVTS